MCTSRNVYDCNRLHIILCILKLAYRYTSSTWGKRAKSHKIISIFMRSIHFTPLAKPLWIFSEYISSTPKLKYRKSGWVDGCRLYKLFIKEDQIQVLHYECWKTEISHLKLKFDPAILRTRLVYHSNKKKSFKNWNKERERTSDTWKSLLLLWWHKVTLPLLTSCSFTFSEHNCQSPRREWLVAEEEFQLFSFHIPRQTKEKHHRQTTWQKFSGT